MNIFFELTLALLIIIVLLRFKMQIGSAMLAGGVFIWATQSAELSKLFQAAVETLSLPRTYDIIFALYFVMCLEIELRLSGVLTDMVKGLRQKFNGIKVLLAIMPAFLGLLPSVGGARFSAPIVEELGADLKLSPEHKTSINFWFRHIFEFSNPIVPGMIMACNIAGVTFGELLRHLAWVTVVAFAVGWFVLIRPIKNPLGSEKIESAEEILHERQALKLALLPMVSIFLIVVIGGLTASMATGIVVAAMYFVLKFSGRGVEFKKIFIGAADLKMALNILGILYFVQLLDVTDVLSAIVTAFKASPLPVPIVIAGVSLIIGILTGMAQGHVSMVMPIVAAMNTGDLNLAGVAMVFGVAGQMLTPTHVCLIITLNYFKADLLKTLKSMLVCEILVTAIFGVVAYLTW